MKQTHQTVKRPTTIEETYQAFSQSTTFDRLTANQRRYAKAVILKLNQASRRFILDWSPADVVDALTGEFVTDNMQLHNYFVAAVPILTRFFQFAAKAGWLTDAVQLADAAKHTREEMLLLRQRQTRSHTVAEVAGEEVPNAIDRLNERSDTWLLAVHQVPMVKNLSDSDRHDVDVIIDTFSGIAILGLNKEPHDWQPETLQQIFYSYFVSVLTTKDKRRHLFTLIPVAMTTFIKTLAGTGEVTNADQLLDWIGSHHEMLVHLYNEELDHFYDELTKAMQSAGIDMTNKQQVDTFTTQYLREHPSQGAAIFTKQQPQHGRKHQHRKRR